MPEASPAPLPEGHRPWVRVTHWVAAAAFITLVFSGFVILMSHPRLYWGETGNDLTPAWLELPISRNYQHGGWTKPTSFFATPGSPVSASRTYDIFNQNGWGRSLHFLAAWFLVVPGAAYLLAGWVSGHFRRNLAPASSELRPRPLWQEVRDHLAGRIRTPSGGPQYGLLQKLSYCAVVFVALPVVVITGLAMSPAVNAQFPFLTGVFGGMQSARSVHFLAFAALVLFLGVHVAMVVRSGFRRQMRAMTWGK